VGAEVALRLIGSRNRRTMAFGTGVLLVAWLGLHAIPAAAAWMRDKRDTLEARQALLDRLEAELAGVDALGDTAKVLQARVIGLAPRILSGASTAEAVNDLVGRVRLATNRSRVKLTRTDLLPDSAVAGRLRRVGVRAGFEGDAQGIVATLRALEADPAALVLDDFRILALNPENGENVAEVLRVEFTVRGWCQAKAGGT
jgi:hypothetical protein